ncbi:MAG: hypothetical protein GYA71_10385, partial [Bacteroidales bacterium]|nr:hypothetical protein [Bacteroidales bacterium]
KTKGLDADQTESAIKATEKMLNIVENSELKIGTNGKSEIIIDNQASHIL